MVAIDLATGDRSVISSPSVGSGFLPAEPYLYPTALQVDFEHDIAYLSDSDSAGIFAVDLGSGDRVLMAH